MHFSFSLSLALLLQEGSIGHDLVIRPIPADVIHPLNTDGKSVHHVVFKRDTASVDEQFSDFGKFSDSLPGHPPSSRSQTFHSTIIELFLCGNAIVLPNYFL